MAKSMPSADRAEEMARPLRLGTAGKEVRWVQRALERLRRGRYPELLALCPDGYFDCRTETAVEQYQSLAGLKADGVVGPVCRRALERDLRVLGRNSAEKEGTPAPAGGTVGADWPGGTLHPGCRGPAVMLLQQRLRRAARRDPALECPPCSGLYDPDTERAVRGFQHRAGLREDGAADEKTWSLLAQIAKE